MRIKEFLNLTINNIVNLELNEIGHYELLQSIIIAFEDCLNDKEKNANKTQIDNIKKLITGLQEVSSKTFAELWDEFIIQKYTE